LIKDSYLVPEEDFENENYNADAKLSYQTMFDKNIVLDSNWEA
jgi:hypothetical protein